MQICSASEGLLMEMVIKLSLKTELGKQKGEIFHLGD